MQLPSSRRLRSYTRPMRLFFCKRQSLGRLVAESKLMTHHSFRGSVAAPWGRCDTSCSHIQTVSVRCASVS